MSIAIIENSQFRRIASNYLRMAITFIVGIWLLKIFLGFGEGVYAVIALTGSTIGVAEILKETVRGATISELGKSYYSKKEDKFQEVYSSILLLSLICACFSVLILSLFIVFLNSFNIPDNLIEATKFYIVTRIIYVFLSIALSPVHNMMPITDRMLSYNVWLTLDRVSDLIAALIASYMLIAETGAKQLIIFSSINLALKLIVLICTTLWSAQSDRRFIPNSRLISLKQLKNVGHLIGWNAAAVISVNLYLRFDILAVNILYGIKATVIFGLASQLAAYICISSMGLVSGLDSVVAQLSKRGNQKQRDNVYSLNRHIVELQAFILGFLFVILSLHTEYIMNWLFSDRLNSNTDIKMIVVCFFMLMAGMIARGMSEGWMGTLTGMGNIKAYAIPVLLGSMLNPILVVTVGYFYELEPGLYLICFVFLVLNVFFHLYYVPRVTSATLGVKTVDLTKPLLLPMALTLLAILIANIAGNIAHDDLIKLALTTVVALLTIGIFFFFRLSKFLRKQF